MQFHPPPEKQLFRQSLQILGIGRQLNYMFGRSQRLLVAALKLKPFRRWSRLPELLSCLVFNGLGKVKGLHGRGVAYFGQFLIGNHAAMIARVNLFIQEGAKKGSGLRVASGCQTKIGGGLATWSFFGPPPECSDTLPRQLPPCLFGDIFPLSPVFWKCLALKFKSSMLLGRGWPGAIEAEV